MTDAPRDGQLTIAGLAHDSGVPEDRIREMVTAGIVVPTADGGFRPGDIQRVQIVAAYRAGGIGLDELAHGLRQRRITFEYSDRIYPEPQTPSGGRVRDIAQRLGDRSVELEALFMALGLPRPMRDRPATVEEERLIPAFVAAWGDDTMSADAPMRAARLLGDATRRAADGWVALFMEAIGVTIDQRAAMNVDELRPRLFDPAVRVSEIFEPMAVWLLRRHLEQALNALNVETMERALELEGVRVRPESDLPGIVFADMSGFTRLTEEYGDERAAAHAATLTTLALGVAEACNGRLVKQLGDGVMLAFRHFADAVEAAVRLRDEARDTALPPLHIGAAGGPVIERDGDYFGRTVNLASRLSAHAGPREVVTNAAGAAAPGFTAAARTMVTLKGFSQPIEVFRVNRSESSHDAERRR